MHLLEPRARPSKVMRWTAPLIAIAATLVVGSLLFWALGKPVVESFHVFFIQPLETQLRLERTADQGLPADPHRRKAWRSASRRASTTSAPKGS
jgi:ABC-type uncharacterized transport system permease subunit